MGGSQLQACHMAVICLQQHQSSINKPAIQADQTQTKSLQGIKKFELTYKLMNQKHLEPTLLSYCHKYSIYVWLRCCATNWKVAGSIPDGVSRIFH
jgi:hypothetical protein